MQWCSDKWNCLISNTKYIDAVLGNWWRNTWQKKQHVIIYRCTVINQTWAMQSAHRSSLKAKELMSEQVSSNLKSHLVFDHLISFAQLDCSYNISICPLVECVSSCKLSCRIFLFNCKVLHLILTYRSGVCTKYSDFLIHTAICCTNVYCRAKMFQYPV